MNKTTNIEMGAIKKQLKQHKIQNKIMKTTRWEQLKHR